MIVQLIQGKFMASQQLINIVTAFYLWFNQIAVPENHFNKEDLEKYVTPDFVMQMNDKIVTRDYHSLYRHFLKFRQSGTIINITMPFDEVVISEDKKKVVIRYGVSKKFPTGEIQNSKVIAIWHIADDGRLQRMNEVVFFNNGPSNPYANKAK
jgi:hypothetical protein